MQQRTASLAGSLSTSGARGAGLDDVDSSGFERDAAVSLDQNDRKQRSRLVVPSTWWTNDRCRGARTDPSGLGRDTEA